VDVRAGLAAHERERAIVLRDVEALGALALDREVERRGDRPVEGVRALEIADADPEVVDDGVARAQDPVVQGLDTVAVGIEQERAVVVLRVDRARPRLAVAGVARVDAGLPDPIDLVARARHERDVQPAGRGARRAGLCDREIVPVVDLAGLCDRMAERAEDRLVEGEARRAVRDAQGHVGEHVSIL
jgi:hypothetical protein